MAYVTFENPLDLITDLKHKLFKSSIRVLSSTTQYFPRLPSILL